MRAMHSSPLTELNEIHNFVMSQVRVSFEWGYGKVYARNPNLKRTEKLKLRSDTEVAMLLRVSVLLTKLHTCTRASLTSNVFYI